MLATLGVRMMTLSMAASPTARLTCGEARASARRSSSGMAVGTSALSRTLPAVHPPQPCSAKQLKSRGHFSVWQICLFLHDRNRRLAFLKRELVAIELPAVVI
jgi:hypothetical protein